MIFREGNIKYIRRLLLLYMVYCRSCGAQIPVNQTYCELCRGKTQGRPSRGPRSPPKPNGVIKTCAFCRGHGFAPGDVTRRCPVCKGYGKNKFYGEPHYCNRCRGYGTRAGDIMTPCSTCGGTGYIVL